MCKSLIIIIFICKWFENECSKGVFILPSFRDPGGANAPHAVTPPPP